MSGRVPTASPLAVVAALILTSVVVAQGDHQAQSDPQIAFLHTAGVQQRLRYLATARIWSDPGDVTPEMITIGRPLKQRPKPRSGLAIAADAIDLDWVAGQGAPHSTT